MISNNELVCFTLLFCFAAYVRFTNIIQEKTKIAEKDVLDAQQQQHFTRRELTHQYSNCSSLPSLTSDDFSDDETSPYDATYCISSDMPFSIPGKPINEKDENQHMNHFLNRNSKDSLQKPCYSAIQHCQIVRPNNTTRRSMYCGNCLRVYELALVSVSKECSIIIFKITQNIFTVTDERLPGTCSVLHEVARLTKCILWGLFNYYQRR